MNKLPSLKRLQTQFKKKSSFTYVIDEKKILLKRIQFQISIKNPEEWLDDQALFPKVFWKQKNAKKTILALGSILNYDSIPNLETSNDSKKGPRFFGGIPFLDSLLSKTKYNVWNNFASSSFFLPEIEISLNNNGNGFLFLNFLKDQPLSQLEKTLSLLTNHQCDFSAFNPNLTQRIDMPNFSTWCDTIEKSLHSFETTPLEKVVLARASYLTYDTPLNSLHLLKQLNNSAKNCTVFGYIPSKAGAFIGVSPETFYQRINEQFFTEAVAGTRAKGKSKEEDLHIISSLKNSEKDNREFNYVTKFLEEKLSLFCENHEIKTKKTVTETSTVYHLHKTFQGILKKSTNDKSLISSLHPTPAMGGHPKTLAMEFLDQSEPFVRGHYASPIGWISPCSSDLIVAIRSAFIKNQCLTLFAGAGIVKGSNPVKEWEELELKISHFLNIGSTCVNV